MWEAPRETRGKHYACPAHSGVRRRSRRARLGEALRRSLGSAPPTNFKIPMRRIIFPMQPELTPQAVLERHFGFREFLDGQELVIRSVLAGDDTLVVMPTGGGKSLCYQLPALLLDGITVVVSPLIALMRSEEHTSELQSRQYL